MTNVLDESVGFYFIFLFLLVLKKKIHNCRNVIGAASHRISGKFGAVRVVRMQAMLF